MLGMIALPWLLKIVKKAKIAGVEFEAQTSEEVEARIESEVRENQPLPEEDEGPAEVAPQDLTRNAAANVTYSYYERLAINRLAALHQGTARTDVRLGGLMLDAVIDTGSKRIAIEVKNVTSARIRKNKMRFVNDVVRQATLIYQHLVDHKSTIDEFWMVIVGHFSSESEEWNTLKQLVYDDLTAALPLVRFRIFSTVSDFDNPSNPMYK